MPNTNPSQQLSSDVLFKHNMGNLKLHYPHLHKILSQNTFQSPFNLMLPIANEKPCCIEPIGGLISERGKEGIIHPANARQEAQQYVMQLDRQHHPYIFVINTGLGFIARQLGERLFTESFQNNEIRRLIFVEEDYGLFRECLRLHNWDVNFWQPQTLWIVGTPISQLHLHPFFTSNPNLFLYEPFLIPGGIQSQREVNDTDSLKQQFSLARSAQNEKVQTQFSSIVHRHKKWNADGKKRVLFLNINQQKELQKSIVQTFRRWGWECSMIAPKSHPQYGHHVYGFYSQWTWLHAMQDLDADFIFLINHIPPDTNREASLPKLHIPIIVWYWDDPKRDRDFPNMNGKDTSDFYIFCYDKNHINYVKQNGYDHVFYMPVGTSMSPDKVNRNLFEKHNGVTYAGSLMTGEAIMNNRVLSVHFPKWYEWLQASLVEIQQGKWFDELDCLQNKPYPEGETLSQTTLVTYLQDAITNQRRTGALERMTKHNLHTYGGKDLLSDSCSPFLKQAYQGRRISYQDELPALYAQTAVNLNLNHFQTTHGIAQRIYDCLAVGGFIITDTNPAITEAFINQEEIVCSESIDELDDLTTYYLSHANEREKIIQKGQETVLFRDTLDIRLKTILATVEKNIL